MPSVFAATLVFLALTSGASLPLHWASSGPPFPLVDAIEVSADGTLYAAARRISDGASALFRSPDGGRSWDPLASPPAGETIRRIAVDPTGTQRLMALTTTATDGVRLYRSDDFGASWRLDREHFAATGAERIFFDPIRENSAFFVSYGLFRSTDNAPWFDVSGSFPPAFSAWIAPDGDLLWAGKVCYGVPCYPNDPQWTEIDLSEDGGDSETGTFPAPCVYLTTVAYASPLLAYAAGLDCVDLLRSEDGGRTWATYDPSGELETLLHAGIERRIEKVVVNQLDPQVLYALVVHLMGPPRGEVLQSTDGGQNWDFVSTPAEKSVTDIALSDGGELFVATPEGVFTRARQTRTIPPRTAD